MGRTTRERVGAADAPNAEDELNNRLFFRLFQASNIYERKAQQELGFSGIQGALLGALYSGPASGIPLSELVEYLAVSRQNLDGVLKRLERQQFVERVEDPRNRRTKMVRITRAGRRAWDSLFANSLAFYRQGTQGLSLEAKQRFVDMLGQTIRSLRSISLADDHGATRAKARTLDERAGATVVHRIKSRRSS